LSARTGGTILVSIVADWGPRGKAAAIWRCRAGLPVLGGHDLRPNRS